MESFLQFYLKYFSIIFYLVEIEGLSEMRCRILPLHFKPIA